MKHGMYHTRFYSIWAGIKSRCNNKNSVRYNYYGGRGIKCLWKSFEDFKKDMYRSYLINSKKFGENKISIDRIDNSDNYCKENCRWANSQQQSRNTRSNVYIKFAGKSMIVCDWAKEIGINKYSLWNRIHKLNWSVEKALTTPLRQKHK